MKVSRLLLTIGLSSISVFFACKNEPPTSIELLNDTEEQKSTFSKLAGLTQGFLQESNRNDSLAFLILPVQAICPSCRNKTIDSIVKNANNLPDHHFIIISANGGRKTINSFFREREKNLPVIEGRLLLDTLNQANKLKLYDAKPTFYYTAKGKAFKKVASIPETVKDDLREFFSGSRRDKK